MTNTAKKAPEEDRCRYSAAHFALGIEATTVLPHPIRGEVKACQRCSAFHERMSEPQRQALGDAAAGALGHRGRSTSVFGGYRGRAVSRVLATANALFESLNRTGHVPGYASKIIFELANGFRDHRETATQDRT